MKRKTYLAIFILIVIQTAPLYATSLDELDRPLLDKGQVSLEPSYDFRYLDHSYGIRYIYKTSQQTDLNYDYHYTKNTFAVEALYGLSKDIELKFNTAYTLNYGYNFNYVESDSSVASANYNWQETNVKYYLPFSVGAGFKARPWDSIELRGDYQYKRFNTKTHIRYGDDMSSASIDYSQRSDSQSHFASAGVTWLSDPVSRDEILMSNLDGIFKPLLEKNQVMIVSDCVFRREKLGFRYYQDFYYMLIQEEYNNISFPTEVTIGVTDSFQASAGFRYYLPYTYRQKNDQYVARAGSTQYFTDLTQKFYGSYETSGRLVKRFGQNLDISVDGAFRKYKYRASQYYYDGRGTGYSVHYPYHRYQDREEYVFKIGETFLSDAKRSRGKLRPNLDGLERPLLEKNQFMVEAFGKYCLTRNDHRLDYHLLPQLSHYIENKFSLLGGFGYGITDRLQFRVDVDYQFPYQLEDTLRDSATNSIINVSTFHVPLRFDINSELIYRITQSLEFSIEGGYAPQADIPYRLDAAQHNFTHIFNSNVRDYSDAGNYPTNPNNSWVKVSSATYYLTAKLRSLF